MTRWARGKRGWADRPDPAADAKSASPVESVAGRNHMAVTYEH